MQIFNVVHNDGAIQVRIEEDGFATLDVHNINDDEVVVRAINQAYRRGARRGTMFTRDVTDEQIGKMHMMRSVTGTTWLDGKVTYLGEGELGPLFRIDWDEFPAITEG